MPTIIAGLKTGQGQEGGMRYYKPSQPQLPAEGTKPNLGWHERQVLLAPANWSPWKGDLLGLTFQRDFPLKSYLNVDYL